MRKGKKRQPLLFRLLALAVLCFSLAPTVRAQPPDGDPAPYLYYYSDVLNGIVIERADGSDSRIIGQGITRPSLMDGAGWSPDGDWFTGQGRIFNVTTNHPLDALQSDYQIYDYWWSTDKRYLLASGTKDTCGYQGSCLSIGYWLVDLDTDTLLATLEMLTSLGSTRFSIPEWSFEDRQVVIYDDELAGMDTRPVRITMRFDGTVIEEPITEAEADAVFIKYVYDDISVGVLDSPSGRYTGTWRGPLLDTQTGQTIPLPVHSNATDGFPMSVKWDSSEEWIILGYDGCIAGGCPIIRPSAVMSMDGRVVREIASCGFGSGCIGWLPDTVDLDTLPPGQSRSVSQSPLTIDFDTPFAVGGIEQPYVKTCNEQGEVLQTASTGEAIFVLPNTSGCSPDSANRFGDPCYPIALSPDQQFYAMPASHEDTGIYDAATGELMGLIDTNPIALAFTEDGSVLEVRSYQALTTWDVQEAISRYSSK